MLLSVSTMSTNIASQDTPHGITSDTFASANESHFDSQAQAADANPLWLELAQRTVKAIRDAYPSLFQKDSTSVLDFACATGRSERIQALRVRLRVGHNRPCFS